MMPLLDNSFLALPEIVLLITANLALLADLFLKPIYRNSVLVVALVGLTVTLAINCSLFGQPNALIFNDLFISDDAGHLMKLFIYLTVILIFIYSFHYVKDRKMNMGDYYVLGLFSTLGMTVLVSAHSLLTIYLGLELLSLPLYALTAMQRDNANASEAAIKYFTMGAIASGMLLFGFSLLYAATGKLDLLDISNAIAVNWQSHYGLLSFSLVFILAGVCFKLAAVPFHMWAPDVYQGAPSSVTLLLSTAPKIAAMGMILRILTIALGQMKLEFQPIIMIIALLSTALGNVLALAQTNIKRLFAYSAIAHIGYALFGVLAATSEGYAASLYYILVYSLMTAAAFGLIVLMSTKDIEIENITDLKGLNKRSPWFAFMMMIVLFSMAGVPPTVGFLIKLAVLKALVDVNNLSVAIIGLFFAVIGAYYYIKIVKVMYFDEPSTELKVSFSLSSSILYSINSLFLLYFGIFPSVLYSACKAAFS